MANIDNVQLPDGSSYNIVDNTSGFATQNYVDSAVDSITKTTIGLGNVDNTSDLNKPVSTAQQTAIDNAVAPKAEKTDIATVESGTTASRAYSVGELVYVSGTLYRIKVPVASGATFTVGTNVEVTNVSNSIPKIAKLWENPNPTSAFASQTVTLASGNYDFLLIIYYANTSGAPISQMMVKGLATILYLGTASGSGARNMSRTVLYISDTSIRFADASVATGASADTVNNSNIIPYIIYGIKF